VGRAVAIAAAGFSARAVPRAELAFAALRARATAGRFDRFEAAAFFPPLDFDFDLDFARVLLRAIPSSPSSAAAGADRPPGNGA
jgi:hypothetical protein